MKLNKISYYTILFGILTIILLLILKHAWTMFLPYPIEFREGHTYSSTVLLLKGIKPYNLDTIPYFYNSYGILYNLIVFPFAYLFGNSLILHRIIHGIFIFLTMVLIFKPYINQKKNIIFNLICMVFLYGGFIFYTNTSVRPDGLGVFLYVLTILIPVRNSFSLKSIILAMLIAILSFYTKPYFLLGWIILSIYMFFFVGYLKTIIYNIVFIIIFFISGIFMFHIYPLYFYETIFAYGNSMGSILYSLEQIFLYSYFGLSVLFFIIILVINIKRINFSLLIKNPYLFFLIIILIFLIYPLGVNSGAYLTYHLQLLSPLLCLFVLSIENDRVNVLKQNMFILILMILFLYRPVRANLRYYDIKKHNIEWRQFSNYLSTKEKVLNSALIAPILLDNNKEIINNGVTDFIFEFKKKPVTNYLFGLDNEILDKKKSYINKIKEDIQKKKFDAIILNPVFDTYYYKYLDLKKYTFKRKVFLYAPYGKLKWELEIYEPNK